MNKVPWTFIDPSLIKWSTPTYTPAPTNKLPAVLPTPAEWVANIRILEGKKRNIWLHGPPGYGKSHWVKMLKKDWTVYQWDWDQIEFQ